MSNGLHYRGEVVISFFHRKEVKEWIGLVTRNQTVYFESWKIPIILLDQPTTNTNNILMAPSTSSGRRPSIRGNSSDQPSFDPNSLSASESKVDPIVTYRNAYDSAVKYIMAVIEVSRFKLFFFHIVNDNVVCVFMEQNANRYIEHIPVGISYDYEIKVL